MNEGVVEAFWKSQSNRPQERVSPPNSHLLSCLPVYKSSSSIYFSKISSPTTGPAGHHLAFKYSPTVGLPDITYDFGIIAVCIVNPERTPATTSIVVRCPGGIDAAPVFRAMRSWTKTYFKDFSREWLAGGGVVDSTQERLFSSIKKLAYRQMYEWIVLGIELGVMIRTFGTMDSQCLEVIFSFKEVGDPAVCSLIARVGHRRTSITSTALEVIRHDRQGSRFWHGHVYLSSSVCAIYSYNQCVLRASCYERMKWSSLGQK